MNDQTLTRKDVAKLFRLSVRSIQRLECSGTLTSFKLGNAVRFRKSDIDKAIEERIAESTKPKEQALA